MDLALKTTASPAAIWVIVVVAVVLLAFWLFMVMVFATRPDPRLRSAADMAGPGAAMLDHGAFGNLGAAPPQPETRVPEQRTPAGGSAPAETTSHPGAGNQA